LKLNVSKVPNESSASIAPERSPISGFVVTFNEQANIADCLKSLEFCDELLVVDSFSTDNTLVIAKELGAKVVQRSWAGYKDQKEFGCSTVSNEWVISLDADERVSEELKKSILYVLEQDHAGKIDPEIAGYEVNRVVFHLGRWWRRGGWYPEYRLRFFRRSRVAWGGTEPHDKVIPSGITKRLDGELLHFSYKDLTDQVNRLNKYSSISVDSAVEGGRGFSVLSLIVNPFIRFFKFYIIKQGFREGVAGFVVATIEAFYTFLKYAKLWEKSRKQKKL
jgi:glycosyltransferase involved in cell wall biosynthesis